MVPGRLAPALLFAAAVVYGLVPGNAKAAADCPPVGHLPSYVTSSEPETRDYDSYEFPVQKNDETTPVIVIGQTCRQSYAVKDGADPMSDLEIQSNYREQLQKLGAEILYTEDGRTVAKLVKGNDERWLQVSSQETQIGVITVAKRPFKQTLQNPSGNDYPLLGHMPAYVADKPEKRSFDKLSFTVQQGDETKDVDAQGAKFVVSYSLRPNAKQSSDLEIQTNYRNALHQLGAEILYTEEGRTVARVEREGRTIWLLVTSQETQIGIKVIEEKAFQAVIQPPKADALKSALDKEGHVALYVNFDFDKASLKPDAAPVIAQVMQLLKDNAGLKLRIEGHTDIIGTREHNQTLSEARAKAVVAALIASGIAADRLSAAGFGPDQPIADNENPEGRAKNRRVELVKS